MAHPRTPEPMVVAGRTSAGIRPEGDGMGLTKLITLTMSAAAALAIGVLAATAGNGSSGSANGSHMGHAMRSTTASTLTQSDLRSTLGRLLGEHAVLAMNATNLGVSGAKSFPAAAKALDRNSVEISKAIGSIYGPKAARTFLDGPARSRPRAEDTARRVRERQLREGGRRLPRRVPPHVHDRRPARRRDRRAEEPALERI
jgi:hypothetical protein